MIKAISRIYFSLVSLLLSSYAQAQIPSLFSDLNTRPNSANALFVAPAATSSLVFFNGTDVEHGNEPWVSDGTQAGTRLLKDINPGSLNSTPSNFTVTSIGGVEIIFFTATTADQGRELWRSDGTPEGTFSIDIFPGSTPSSPSSITKFGQAVLFSADSPGVGRELWISAGTAATTTLLKDIFPGPDSGMSFGVDIVIVPGTSRAVFPAVDSTHGSELWRTDGTSATTQLVGDLAANSSSSSPQSLLAVSGLGRVYFTATDGQNPFSIYSSDGVAVTLVKLLPDEISVPSDFAVLTNTSFVFQATTLATGREIWRSDGTANGTFLVADVVPGDESPFNNFSGIRRLVGINNFALFSFDLPFENPPAGIFSTDGTNAGTKAISDLRASFTSNILAGGFNGRLYFRATNAEVGGELFSSDGTAQGTRLEAELFPGNLSSSPSGFIVFKNALHFFATTPTNGSLFRITTLGAIEQVADLTVPGTQSSSPGFGPNAMTVGNKFFFAATDGNHGSEPFVTDGTQAGTRMVKDIRVGSDSSSSFNYVALNNLLIFDAFTDTEGRELWASDGTESGTQLLKDIKPGGASGLATGRERFKIGDKVLFGADDGVRGQELWGTDGTSAGTQIVKDINIGAGSGFNDNNNPQEVTALNDILYFAGNDSGNNTTANVELWRSDGTPSGTFRVKDINPLPNESGFPRSFEALPGKGIILFSALKDNATGLELWKSDGSEAGTALVKDILPGTGQSSAPRNIRGIGQVAVFSALTPNNMGEELWVTDGTEGGTQLLRDINMGTGSSGVQPFGVLNNRAFFLANDGVNGSEVWVTDGSVGGTFLLKDFNPGPLGVGVVGFAVTGNTAFFRVSFLDAASVLQTKLVRSDGTSEGTVEISVNGLTGVGAPSFFRGRLFFSALDPTVGFEPQSILLDGCPDDPNKVEPGACGCGVVDSDANGNGIADCVEPDGCSSDPVKTAPGVCGCGIPDVDDNANGILDCLSNADLKAQLTDLQKSIQKLRVPKNKKQKAAAKQLKSGIADALTKLVEFSKVNSSLITISGKGSLKTLSSMVEKRIKRALRLSRNLRSDKKQAVSAIRRLLKGL